MTNIIAGDCLTEQNIAFEVGKECLELPLYHGNPDWLAGDNTWRGLHSWTVIDDCGSFGHYWTYKSSVIIPY